MKTITGVQSEVGQLFQDLVELLVDCPDNVRVNELPGATSTILEVVASGGEFGRVVGKRGVLADALREIARCLGWRDHRQYKLDVIDGDRSQAGTPAPIQPERVYDEVVKKMLERIIRRLVNNPDEVVVDVYAGKQAVMLEVTVDVLDTKRLIGRSGGFAEALRTVLRSLGAKRGRRYALEVVDLIDQVESAPRTAHDARA